MFQQFYKQFIYKQFIFYLFLLLSFSISTVAHATPATDLAQLLSVTKTMQANFTQTIYDNKNKPIQESIGRIAMQRPGKFRWEVTKPIPQLIIANESRLWIYDPDLEQVTIRILKQAAGDSPALLLSHTNVALEQEYQVLAIQKKESTLTWFKLVPKKADSMFAAIQLGFQKNQIDQMQLQDHLGHTTLIQFERARLNQPLSSALFTFKPPRGIDIIDETRR